MVRPRLPRSPESPHTPDTPERVITLWVEALRRKARMKTTTSPLSYGQKALWFLYLSAPDSPAYHVSFSARIHSALDVDALRRSFQQLIERHGALRAAFKAKVDKANIDAARPADQQPTPMPPPEPWPQD